LQDFSPVHQQMERYSLNIGSSAGKRWFLQVKRQGAGSGLRP
jgi:hypothetical protein